MLNVDVISKILFGYFKKKKKKKTLQLFLPKFEDAVSACFWQVFIIFILFFYRINEWSSKHV